MPIVIADHFHFYLPLKTAHAFETYLDTLLLDLPSESVGKTLRISYKVIAL